MGECSIVFPTGFLSHPFPVITEPQFRRRLLSGESNYPFTLASWIQTEWEKCELGWRARERKKKKERKRKREKRKEKKNVILMCVLEYTPIYFNFVILRRKKR